MQQDEERGRFKDVKKDMNYCNRDRDRRKPKE